MDYIIITGAFIMAYLILLLLLILPLAALEAALGQYTGKSVIKVWNVIPLFKGKLQTILLGLYLLDFNNNNALTYRDAYVL